MLRVSFDTTEIDIRFVPVLLHAATKGKSYVTLSPTDINILLVIKSVSLSHGERVRFIALAIDQQKMPAKAGSKSYL